MSAPAGGRYAALVVMPSLIGDSVLVSGLLRHIRDRHPGAEITIASSPLAGSLFAETGGVVRVIPWRKQRYKTHWPALWRQVLRRWDLVVDMRGSGLAYLLPARRRLVHRAPPASRAPEHRVVTAARLVGRAADPPDPLVECLPATDARAEALLAGPGPLLALAPGATWPGKVWPADRFVSLAATLIETDPHLRGGRVVLTGGRGDDVLNAPLRAALGAGRVVDLVGLDVLTTFACLKRVRLFVGNDSGMMHTAATAGAPTLGLFGPSPDALFSPWGRATAVARGPRAHAAFGMDRRDFDWRANHMGDLSVDAVLEAAASLLDRTAPLFAPPVRQAG